MNSSIEDVVDISDEEEEAVYQNEQNLKKNA